MASLLSSSFFFKYSSIIFPDEVERSGCFKDTTFTLESEIFFRKSSICVVFPHRSPPSNEISIRFNLIYPYTNRPIHVPHRQCGWAGFRTFYKVFGTTKVRTTKGSGRKNKLLLLIFLVWRIKGLLSGRP
mgnify:CR=1 FL=1